MKKIYSFLLTLLTLLCLASCSKNDAVGNSGGDDEVVPDRAILLYMMANNTLNSYLKTNLYELVAGYDESSCANCEIYVYFKGSDTSVSPVLLHVNNNISVDTIKIYDDHNSATAQVLREVIDDFKDFTPTATERGVLFSSHGSGWLPSTYSTTKAALSLMEDDCGVVTKSFGQDGDSWFELEELAAVLNDSEFSYIIFDSCLMGGIETVYALRNKSDYLVASVAEVLGSGFNYDNMAVTLASTYSLQTRLTIVASDYCDKQDYYTVSLYNLNNTAEFFANYSALLSSTEDLVGSCTSTNVQQFGRSQYTGIYFDVVDYISQLYDSKSAMEVKEWLEDVIVYKNSTDALYVGFSGFQINTFCGLTTYIPFENYQFLTPLYKETEWYKEISYASTDTENSTE